VEAAAQVARLLVYTGARRGEWWGGATVLPNRQHLRLTGKGQAPRILAIDAAVWSHVAAHVPCAIPYNTFAKQLARACVAAGVPHLRVHDLRHLCGQFLADAGVPESVIGQWLGHTTASMTRRYTRRVLRAGDAAALVAVVVPQFLPTPRRLATCAPVAKEA
jgi:integrase